MGIMPLIFLKICSEHPTDFSKGIHFEMDYFMTGNYRDCAMVLQFL